MTLECRFWSKVFKTETCWLWTAGKRAKRYGSFTTPEYPKGEAAHRVSWKLHYGPIPTGLNVLHKCDVPLCIRPDHLFLGTQSANVNDCEAKHRGNHPRGDENGRSVLTENQVKEIKSRLTGKWGEGRALAQEYKVRDAVISDIKHEKNWAWV